VYREAEFEPAEAAGALLDGVGEFGRAVRERAETEVEGMELTAREAEQRVRRAQRGAERDELLAQLEELAAWYRDLVVVAAGAESAVIHYDRLAELREDARVERMLGAERACEAVRQTWRNLEEFQLNAGLALEGLLVTLRRELAA
jgi:DNA polymerase III subunit delta'